MAKEKGKNLYQAQSDIEKHLKADKSFMANRSAAEFDAFVEGAVWMMKEKDAYIDKLKERIKNDTNKVLELEEELAPFRENYADYDFVQKRTKKTKKRDFVPNDDSDDDVLEFQEDDYSDINGDDFEDED